MQPYAARYTAHVARVKLWTAAAFQGFIAQGMPHKAAARMAIEAAKELDMRWLEEFDGST